jgi:hypothetical protein
MNGRQLFSDLDLVPDYIGHFNVHIKLAGNIEASSAVRLTHDEHARRVSILQVIYFSKYINRAELHICYVMQYN